MVGAGASHGREVVDDDVLGLAAQLSYYFFLALFPAILFLLALASFFPLSNITDDVGRSLGPFVSPQVLELIPEQMRRLANNDNGGVLTFGVAGALWSSSAALVSIVGAVNRAYDISEGRPWWKVRLIATGLTLSVAAIVLVAFSLVLIGPTVAEKLGSTTGWGAPFEWVWLVLQWPLVFALVVLGIGLIYYFGPDADQDWVWITPGAVAAATLWLVISLLFKSYVANFTDYEGSYGTVGGVIVVLLWFYVSSIAILTGAELNAEMEHASPYGKAPGQKNAQGKLVIGARAERAFRQRQLPGGVAPEQAVPSIAPVTAKPGLGAAVDAYIVEDFVYQWTAGSDNNHQALLSFNLRKQGLWIQSRAQQGWFCPRRGREIWQAGLGHRIRSRLPEWPAGRRVSATSVGHTPQSETTTNRHAMFGASSTRRIGRPELPLGVCP